MARLHELEKEYILENYPKFGPKIVSEKLNRSSSTIIKFAKENNLIIGKDKMSALDAPDFLVNLDFYSRFEDEMTKELAYFLGFFWADGTISRNTSLVIEITEEDGENLIATLNEVFPFREHKRKREGRKPQISFSVNNKKVGELLNKLGKYPKSVESHEKIYNYINNKDLWIYFLRGLIDGDGNFYINEKEKYGQFTLASSLNQDWSFLLENLKDFNPHIQTTEKSSGNSSVLRITGRDNITKFIEYLKYKDITIGLTRKQEKALNIIKLYEENPPKDWKKHVLQFTKEGQFIREYNSTLEASELTKIGKSSIKSCLIHISKSAGGYVWIYKEEYKETKN
jgi:hypothetical protein